MSSVSDAHREFLRHAVATLAYRGEKAVRSAPREFDMIRACETCRTAVEVLKHIADLLDWALRLAKGERGWQEKSARSWETEVQRFFDALQQLDDYLAGDAPLAQPPEKIFQGPIADAINHVGQIATLRRLAGSPVRGENYFRAEIVIGRVGPEQSSQRVEFD
jgi:hypothetical protein